jgi:hypothetical protein
LHFLKVVTSTRTMSLSGLPVGICTRYHGVPATKASAVASRQAVPTPKPNAHATFCYSRLQSSVSWML